MSVLLSWALSASLTLAAVLVLRLALGRFLSPRGRLFLWALAGIRLALPATFPNPLAGLWKTRVVLSSSLSQTAALPASPAQTVLPAAGQTAAAAAPFPLWTVIWGMGAVLLAGWFLVTGIRLIRRSRSLPAAEEETLALAHRLAGELGRDSLPLIRRGGERPFTAGVFRPVVVLPAQLPQRHLEQALLHELCHWKNRDPLLTWAALALLCLHWYNPLAWAAFFAWRADLELRCDGQVVALTGRRQDYAHLLMDCSKGSWLPSGAVQSGGSGLRERIRSLSRSRPAARVVLPLTLLAAIILVIFLGDVASRPAETAETGAAPSQSQPPAAYEDWGNALQSTFALADGQFVFTVPDTLPGEDLTLSLEGEWVTGDDRQTFLTGKDVPAGTAYSFPLPDPLPESLSLAATLTDSRGGLIYSCSFMPNLEALVLQMPPYGDGSFDPDAWINMVGDSIQVDGDFLQIGLPVLPEGWTPQVLIAGRVAMGEDNAMSWHDDNPSTQPGMIYYRDLPEGLLDLTITYPLFSPTGEAAGEGMWEWSDQTDQTV